MLQFIAMLISLFVKLPVFQYISCCSLSSLFLHGYFATQLFQYISCCSLSAELAEYYIKRFGFQYISCCSLSIIADVSAIRWKGFNTSHVVVYQNCNHWSGQMLCCFNTSHVVVYRSLPKVLRIYIIVSIHLMLQFIIVKCFALSLFHWFQYISCCSLSPIIYRQSGYPAGFQYISCCSLSAPQALFQSFQRGFNTSHVVVYLFLPVVNNRSYHVSIHLMLQFIFVQGKERRFLLQFQYISCCSLSIGCFFYAIF